MGIDAWGWDRPLHLQAQEVKRTRRRGVFWEAHQMDLEYSQIERLVGLDALPATGFEVSCFPLRILGAAERTGSLEEGRERALTRRADMLARRLDQLARIVGSVCYVAAVGVVALARVGRRRPPVVPEVDAPAAGEEPRPAVPVSVPEEAS